MLKMIEELVSSGKLQYNFILIDTDLPRDPEDRPISVSDEEVIPRLYGDGRDGRLLRMAEF